MGTRASVGFRLKGSDFFMYHHNSGGLDYLGMHVMQFCAQHEIAQMRERVGQFIAVSDEVPTAQEIRTVAPFMALTDEAVADLMAKRKPAKGEEPLCWDDILSDITGTELDIFMSGLNFWPEYNDFIQDDSCEWGYVINLDTEMLELYTGHYAARGSSSYPKVTVKGRYAEKYVDSEGSKKARGCTLIDEIPLSTLHHLPLSAMRSYAARACSQY